MLTAFLDSATAFALPVTLLASTASTVFVVAGWRRRRELLQRQGRPLAADPIELGQTTFASGLLDVIPRRQRWSADLRASPRSGSLPWNWRCSPALRCTPMHAPCARSSATLFHAPSSSRPAVVYLLVAAHVGGRVQITVSDDGAPPDRDLQASRLRPAERLAALQGATMDIDARAGQGTTVVLRLPAGVTSRCPGIEADALDPASASARAERLREPSSAAR